MNDQSVAQERELSSVDAVGALTQALQASLAHQAQQRGGVVTVEQAEATQAVRRKSREAIEVQLWSVGASMELADALSTSVIDQAVRGRDDAKLLAAIGEGLRGCRARQWSQVWDAYAKLRTALGLTARMPRGFVDADGLGVSAAERDVNYWGIAWNVFGFVAELGPLADQQAIWKCDEIMRGALREVVRRHHDDAARVELARVTFQQYIVMNGMPVDVDLDYSDDEGTSVCVEQPCQNCGPNETDWTLLQAWSGAPVFVVCRSCESEYELHSTHGGAK